MLFNYSYRLNFFSFEAKTMIKILIHFFSNEMKLQKLFFFSEIDPGGVQQFKFKNMDIKI